MAKRARIIVVGCSMFGTAVAFGLSRKAWGVSSKLPNAFKGRTIEPASSRH